MNASRTQIWDAEKAEWEDDDEELESEAYDEGYEDGYEEGVEAGALMGPCVAEHEAPDWVGPIIAFGIFIVIPVCCVVGVWLSH